MRVDAKNDREIPTAWSDEQELLDAVLQRDERAWRELVARFDPPLREVVRAASAGIQPLTDTQIDDVIGDFWLRLVQDDCRLLRAFNPGRRASLLTWLTFHVAHVAHDHMHRIRTEPPMVS